jgi:acetyltransferase
MKMSEHNQSYPYPDYLISNYQLSDGKNITIRPIKSTDGNMLQEFVRHLSSQNKHAQFMESFKELSDSMLKKITQIDYNREMVLIATHQQNSSEIIIAMARYVENTDQDTCESIVVVADAWQNKKIARQLMNILMEVAKTKGFKNMTGSILASNIELIELAKHLGFAISNSDDPTVQVATKRLI